MHRTLRQQDSGFAVSRVCAPCTGGALRIMVDEFETDALRAVRLGRLRAALREGPDVRQAACFQLASRGARAPVRARKQARARAARRVSSGRGANRRVRARKLRQRRSRQARRRGVARRVHRGHYRVRHCRRRAGVHRLRVLARPAEQQRACGHGLQPARYRAA